VGVTSFGSSSGCGLTGPQKYVTLFACKLRLDCLNLINYKKQWLYSSEQLSNMDKHTDFQLKLKLIVAKRTACSDNDAVDDVSPIIVRMSDNLTLNLTYLTDNLNNTQKPNNATVQVLSEQIISSFEIE